MIETIGYDPFIFWEGRAPEWLLEPHVSPEWEAEIAKWVNPSWRVLELGCGDGRWSDAFADYTGSDISPTLLAEAKRRHPGKKFAHHDMRQGVSGEWDLIFTFTAWLHVPPKDIRKVRLPDCNYLFVEPHGRSESEHCFRHSYQKLFGCEILGRKGALTLYGRLK